MPTAYWGCVVAGVQESDSRHLAPGSATGARRQMGPASLPTPLSPMRGRVPSTRVFKGHRLGIRCFPLRPFENGLQVRSPALAPASGSTLRSARFRPLAIQGSLACLAQPRFNGRFRSLAFHWWTAPGTITSRSGPKTFARRHLRQPTGMARPATRNLRPSVIDPPCVRPKALAPGSRKARGQNPLRLPGFGKPLPFRSLDHRGEKLSWPFR